MQSKIIICPLVIVIIYFFSTNCSFAQQTAKEECWQKRERSTTICRMTQTSPQEIKNLRNISHETWLNLKVSQEEVKKYFDEIVKNNSNITIAANKEKLWVKNKNNKIIGCYDNTNKFLALKKSTKKLTISPPKT